MKRADEGGLRRREITHVVSLEDLKIALKLEDCAVLSVSMGEMACLGETEDVVLIRLLAPSLPDDEDETRENCSIFDEWGKGK